MRAASSSSRARRRRLRSRLGLLLALLARVELRVRLGALHRAEQRVALRRDGRVAVHALVRLAQRGVLGVHARRLGVRRHLAQVHVDDLVVRQIDLRRGKGDGRRCDGARSFTHHTHTRHTPHARRVKGRVALDRSRLGPNTPFRSHGPPFSKPRREIKASEPTRYHTADVCVGLTPP